METVNYQLPKQQGFKVETRCHAEKELFQFRLHPTLLFET